MEAIEWMELQGMKSAIRPRDNALVASLWTRRLDATMAAGDAVKTVPLLQALVEDFKGLRDVQPQGDLISQLLKDPATKRALDRQREADQAELRTLEEIGRLEAGLADSSTRNESFAELRRVLEDCRKKATAPDGSPQRDSSLRILRVVTMGASERMQDQEYLKLLQQYR